MLFSFQGYTNCMFFGGAMELKYNNLEFNEEEINVLVKRLNDLYKSQQSDFANLCYTVYRIDCWFSDNEDVVLKSKTNDYYNKKALFKQLGFTNKQVRRNISCYQKYMTLDDVGSKLKDVFKNYSESQLIELLPVENDILMNYINAGDIKPDMTIKEIRAFLKSKSENNENFEENDEINLEIEDKFLILKNDQARKDFLENYLSWGLWFEEPRLKLKYYRCKIGEKILVVIAGKEDWGNNYYGGNIHDSHKYFYMTENEELLLNPTCSTQILKDMSALADKKVYLF